MIKSSKMKAVLFYAPQDIRVEQIDIPLCAPDEILVRVDACAVCGSDMKAAAVGNPRIIPPKVMGHEFTGLIEEVGALVKGYTRGERIVMATSISCGCCLYCRQGHRNLCRDLAPMGYSYHGGMAQYVVIPSRAIVNGHLVKVPAEIPAQRAALAEPISCAVNSVENCRIKQGDSVVVIGAGPMGILNACVARSYGASTIIFAEVNEDRLRQCESFGFTRLVNPARENLRQVVLSMTDGYGADVVIVAAPAAAPQQEALDLVRKRGIVMLFASLPMGKSDLVMDSRKIHYNELTITGSSDSSAAHVAKAVEILCDPTFPADKLVTHTMQLEQIEEAFELMRRGESLRVVLKP